jgi:DNA repair protein SbcD/Mre11
MVTFAHIADCHLGCWRQEELLRLNFLSFQKIIEEVISREVDFVLLAGDLFDSAYPPIEILKESFAEFKKLRDAKIPVYLIAGSHDFSASGKTFLDVLEKAGFCKNVENFELQDDGKIKLKPTFHDDIAIYGYPGKKSGMEVEDLRRVYFEGVHQKTIFMLHTTIKDIVGTIPMDSIEKEKLPIAHYYALGHIHQHYEDTISDSRYVYPGPTFPANFQELADLKYGSFRFVEMEGSSTRTELVQIKLKDVVHIEVIVENGLTATEEIIAKLDRQNLKDKIVLLRLKGVLTQGKTGDIRFQEIEAFAHRKECYSFLRNISGIKNIENTFDLVPSEEDNVEKIEEKIMREYVSKDSGNSFNKYLSGLMSALSIEKNEDEKSQIFENRLFSELKSVLELEEVI